MPSILPRLIAKRLKTALTDTPVVIVHGARQSGKTTLARQVASHYKYFTFDDTNLATAASKDPVGFVERLGPKVILDEIQHVPELFPEIKKAVDNDRRPGRFLLTGSANLLLMPQLSESLAGRMEVVRLHPLAQCEIEKREPEFLAALLAGDVPAVPAQEKPKDLYTRILRGGFPEAIQRRDPIRSQTWHEQYLDAILFRDAPEIFGIRHADQLPRLMSRLAAQSGQLLNVADAAKGLQITRQTADAYIQLLESLFVVERLLPWSSNRIKRLVKAPKIHIADAGLLCVANDVTLDDLKTGDQQFGHVLETFVFDELRRQASGFEEKLQFGHYRDKDGHEVDVVIQAPGRRLLGLEIKASATIRNSDFHGIRALERAAKRQLLAGVVLYQGTHTLSFGDRYFALPLHALWSV
jgi:hypothetical protein